jgi:RNA polymerase sigma factor FliA
MRDSMLYKENDQNELIIEHLPLVKRVVAKMNSKNSQYEEDDLINIGVIGLIDAISKYDPKKKVPFEAYASLRIRGTIIDELRKVGPVSRNKIDKLNEYYRAKEELENEFKRSPSEIEICERLEIGQKELSKLHETVHYLSNVSLDNILFTKDENDGNLLDVLEDRNSETPEEELISKENKKSLIKAIDKLKKREKTILNLYYVESLTLKEIAYILDISIPRVSQIHGNILLKLRDFMEEL